MRNYKQYLIIKRDSELDYHEDVNYAKYKEMLKNFLKDVIEILCYDIGQDLNPKKRLSNHYLSISNN